MDEKISMRCESCGKIHTESQLDADSVDRAIDADGTLELGFCRDCIQDILRSPFKQLELVGRATRSDKQD